jgi:site-specific DNA-methyltransferase (adenine-specific)
MNKYNKTIIDNSTLYLGDCLEVMKIIPDKSINMILCDLPYGTTNNSWDSVIDLSLLWKQYNRVCKDNSAIVLFSQTPFDKVLSYSNLKMLKYEWIWNKEIGSGHLNSKIMPLKNHENILVFYKKQSIYNPQMRKGIPYTCKSGNGSKNYGDQTNIITKNNGDRFPVSIIKFKRDKNRLHPTQKPVLLLQYLIKTYTLENETVLDNCMGSGSTGIACKYINRNFIGIEKDEKYFNLSVDRIRNPEKQLKGRKSKYDLF